MDENEIIDSISTTLNAGRVIPSPVSFPLIIKAISGFDVISLNNDDNEDVLLLERLEGAVSRCASYVQRNPILHTRPNEVGNYIETPLKNQLSDVGFIVETPSGAAGAQTSGYPDILIREPSGRPTYLEVKTYKPGSESSSFRSFYLSHSDTFKVNVDARHLLVAFRMISTPAGSGKQAYSPEGWSVRDLSKLDCGLKLEFQSNNKTMYRIAPEING